MEDDCDEPQNLKSRYRDHSGRDSYLPSDEDVWPDRHASFDHLARVSQCLRRLHDAPVLSDFTPGVNRRRQARWRRTLENYAGPWRRHDDFNDVAVE